MTDSLWAGHCSIPACPAILQLEAARSLSQCILNFVQFSIRLGAHSAVTWSTTTSLLKGDGGGILRSLMIFCLFTACAATFGQTSIIPTKPRSAPHDLQIDVAFDDFYNMQYD